MDRDGNVTSGDSLIGRVPEKQLNELSDKIREQLGQEIAVSIQDLSALSPDWKKIDPQEPNLPINHSDSVNIDGFQIVLRNTVKVFLYESTRNISGEEVKSICLQAEKTRGFVTAGEYKGEPIGNSKFGGLLERIREVKGDSQVLT